jgi:hypothetical protein
MISHKNKSGRGGFLPESNDPSTGLIPLEKVRWSEIGVRFPNPLFLLNLIIEK